MQIQPETVDRAQNGVPVGGASGFDLARRQRLAAPGQPHVALLTRDSGLARDLSIYLTRHGIRLTIADGIADMRRLATDMGPDLALVDLDQAHEDGISLMRHLRERRRMAIVALSGSGDSIERIVAIETGADDCLTKPLEPRELLARIRGMLRRISEAYEAGRRSVAEVRRVVSFGTRLLDLEAGRMTTAEGEEVALTALELQLLRTFAENPNRALNRDQLCEMAHGRCWSPLDRSIDIRISRLRAKIERDPARPEVIVTVRGIGYRFACEG